MTPKYNKVHNAFKFNNTYYSFEYLKELAYSLIKEGEDFERPIGNFLNDWLDSKPYIEVSTSGSTGIPKRIRLSKQAMVHSAISTGDFFNLKPGDKALHCLPFHYIAGKMMLVRAIILGLEIDIVKPTSQPVFDYDIKYDFCAMIPIQLEKTKSYVHNIGTLIVGGAQVSQALKRDLKTVSAKVFETYGMTETMTHIALKPLQTKTSSKTLDYDCFEALPNVALSIDKRNCLCIEAPALLNEKLITNDVVELVSETRFKWLGRMDNVINSGGVKIFPEQVEAKLQSTIAVPFFIAALPHKTLGDQVTLIVEGDPQELSEKKFKGLETFEKPKQTYWIEEFVKTPSGKLQRAQTLAKIKINN